MRTSTTTIAFASQPVLDLRLHTDPANIHSGMKIETKFTETIGGGGPNAAVAANLAGIQAIPILLTGNDARRSIIESMSRKVFPNAIVLPILKESRMSLLCGETCLTVRPPLVSQSLSTAAAEVIRSANWTVIAPMAADDSCFVNAILDRARHSLLQLSTSQLRSTGDTLRLCRKATWVILNQTELKTFSNRDRVADGLKWLRSQGVVNVLVTGSKQIGALVDSQQIHLMDFQPLSIQGSTIGAGDHFTGTFAANMALHGKWRYAIANAHKSTSQFLTERQPKTTSTLPQPIPKNKKLTKPKRTWRKLSWSTALAFGFLSGIFF